MFSGLKKESGIKSFMKKREAVKKGEIYTSKMRKIISPTHDRISDYSLASNAMKGGDKGFVKELADSKMTTPKVRDSAKKYLSGDKDIAKETDTRGKRMSDRYERRLKKLKSNQKKSVEKVESNIKTGAGLAAGAVVGSLSASSKAKDDDND